MTNTMTPIELLRVLFGFTDVVDDYQLVARIFQEATHNRVALELTVPPILREKEIK